MHTDTQPQACFLTNITVHASAQNIYVTAEDQVACAWRLLKIERSLGPDLNVSEDPTSYTERELHDVLSRLHIGNRVTGGLRTVAGPCPALIGYFRSNTLPYLVVVTRGHCVGKICGADIYSIDATALIPLYPPSVKSGAEASPAAQEEAHIRRLLSVVTDTKQFLYAFQWPVWMTLQRAMAHKADILRLGCESFQHDHHIWNAYMAQPLFQAIGNARWTVPLVHGAFEQRHMSLSGQPLTLTVIARRSRHFAGTRYHRRGVNDAGFVANDVEIEQIVQVFPAGRQAPASFKSSRNHDTAPEALSSVVQVRGSVPLQWIQGWGESHDGGGLWPSIRMLHHLDPLRRATALHFQDLRRRYGDPIACLDLLRQNDARRQESTLHAEYKKTVATLNRRLDAAQRIQYVEWDLRRHARSLGSNLLADLHRVQGPLLQATGVYVAAAPVPSEAESDEPNVLETQRGVVRTNCMDCLDRTNVSQFAFGLLALGKQLQALGVGPETGNGVEPQSSMAAELMSVYEAVGHAVSQQYGGSEAHTGLFRRWRGDWEAAHHGRELLTAIRRLYSNAVTDDDKQAAIDMFLGVESSRVSQNSALPQVKSSRQLREEEGGGRGDDHMSKTYKKLAETEGGLTATLSTASLASSVGESDADPTLQGLLSAAALTDKHPHAKAKENKQTSETPPKQAVYILQNPRSPWAGWARRPAQEQETAANIGSPVALVSLDEVMRKAMPSVDITAVAGRRAMAMSTPSWFSPQSKPAGKSPLEHSEQQADLSGYSFQKRSSNRLLRTSSMDSIGREVPRPSRRSSSAGTYSGHTRDARGRRIVNWDNTIDEEGHDTLDDVSPVLPSGTGSYHSLASLNLEGATLPKPPSVLTASEALGAPGLETSTTKVLGLETARRLSTASFAVLRSFLAPGTSSSTKEGLPSLDVAAQMQLNGVFTHRASPSTSQLLDMDLSSVLTRHKTFPHGLDDLGLPAAIAPLWRRHANVVKSFEDMRARTESATKKDLRRLSTPMTMTEWQAAERKAAAALRARMLKRAPAVKT